MTVIRKDHNGQVDWWLCELRGHVGMVPANYFEIFHDHDPTVYDTPKSARTTPVPPLGQDETEGPVYDIPPTDFQGGHVDRDYDLPPAEAPDYDRPPSSNRSSLKSSSASLKLNRLSQTSASSCTSNSLYDVPPDPADVYDFPKSNAPARAFDNDDRGPQPVVDISAMYDEQAEEFLANYRQRISDTYERLFESVYGPDSYWGSDNKPRRTATLHKTILATKEFDYSLMKLLEFGRGVLNSLESLSSDANFKKKYTSAFRGLLQKRHDILMKVESLSSETESITAIVKSLLEVARTVPSAVTEFTVLVQANKALLFKASKVDSTLPVITKNEVKSRPLPDLPVDVNKRVQRNSSDYASIPTSTFEPRQEQNSNTPARKPDESSLDWASTRKRKPNDDLPPLPYATIPRPLKPKAQDPIRPRSPYDGRHSPYDTRRSPYNGRQSPLFDGRKSPYEGRRSPLMVRTKAHDVDYDDIDALESAVHRPRMNRSLSGPGGHRIHRQSIGSDGSGSSDEQISLMKRSNSVELLDGPYGRAALPNGYHNRPSSPPQTLKPEEREMLERFSKQMELIVPSLRESIDVFLDCLKDSEPPKDFVTKSKLAVVAAYKLVYIADALTQKILHNETKAEILGSSNMLTENIKNLVCDTKTAALQYPSVMAMDKMAGSLRKVFPAALDLVNSVKTRSTLV